MWAVITNDFLIHDFWIVLLFSVSVGFSVIVSLNSNEISRKIERKRRKRNKREN
jgi:hypothetical protein